MHTVLFVWWAARQNSCNLSILFPQPPLLKITHLLLCNALSTALLAEEREAKERDSASNGKLNPQLETDLQIVQEQVRTRTSKAVKED